MRIAYRSLAAVVVLVAPTVLQAQTAPPAPKPGPEQQKLAYFAGRWNGTGEMKPGPMGPGGRMTGTSNCDWFPGGFYLTCRSNGTSPSGPAHSLGIMGYSSERKRYTFYGIDNSGMGAEPWYGVLTGDTWNWEGEALMGGQTIKGRYVIKQVSPDKYTWTWEMGGALVAEGTETRAK